MNKISQTIIDCHNEFITKYGNNEFWEEDSTDCDKWKVQDYLLQSQIKVIEALMSNLEKEKLENRGALGSFADGYTQALEDQISSLTQVLTELKNI